MGLPEFDWGDDLEEELGRKIQELNQVDNSRARAIRQLAIEFVFAKLVAFLEYPEGSDGTIRDILNLPLSAVLGSAVADVDGTAYANVFDRIRLLLILDHEDPTQTKE